MEVVVSILSYSPDYKPKEIAARLRAYPDFPFPNFAALSSSELRRIKKAIAEKSTLLSLFPDHSFPLEFDPSALRSLFKFQDDDPLLSVFFHHITLYSYVAFLVEWEATGSLDGLPELFAAITSFRAPKASQLTASVITGILSILLSHLTVEHFDQIFVSLSDFFMHQDLSDKQNVQTYFHFLPRYFEKLLGLVALRPDSARFGLSGYSFA